MHRQILLASLIVHSQPPVLVSVIVSELLYVHIAMAADIFKSNENSYLVSVDYISNNKIQLFQSSEALCHVQQMHICM